MLTGVSLRRIPVRAFPPRCAEFARLDPSCTSRGICKRRQQFGAFISPLSIANQLFANVAWVLAITRVCCAGVRCLCLQGPSCSSWDIRALLDSGTVKQGSFGAELTQTDACSVNASWSYGAGLSRAQRHHTAWMPLASPLLTWSELTA